MATPIKAHLADKHVQALRRVIERCDGIECGTLQPGIEAGLPFHDSQATITSQRESAKAILKLAGLPVIDSGVG